MNYPNSHKARPKLTDNELSNDIVPFEVISVLCCLTVVIRRGWYVLILHN